MPRSAPISASPPADRRLPAGPAVLPFAREQSSGAAWASVGVPNLAIVDARVDPSNDQGKLGTTFKHSIPVGSNFA